jgi:hypothetical protein
MRKQIWRMAAAVVGTVALVSAAAAQVPAPMPTKIQATAPAVQPVPVQPAPAHIHPAPGQPVPVQPAPAVVAPAPVVNGGCGPAGCGAGCSGTYDDCCGSGGKHGRKGGGLFHGSGTASPVGCGCCAAEKTFMFGSCSQFFTPGRTCGGHATGIKGCGGHCGGLFGHGRRDCPLPVYAAPYGRPADSCSGPFSYLDR